jgi:exopolysaccharide biosynthesis polyprenyl glycosylphosphotransferase
VVAWAVVGAYVVSFGLEPHFLPDGSQVPYWILSVALAAAWWIMLGAWGSRESRVLGAGSDEYRLVVAATLWLFGAIAIFSYAFKVETARGYVGIALPAGTVGLLLGRWLMRQHLSIRRLQGRSMSRLMIIGGSSGIPHIASALSKDRNAGYKPVAAYSPGGAEDRLEIQRTSNLPMLGHEPTADAILRAINNCQADVVAVTAGVQLSPSVIRELGWELAARNIGLIVAPALTDVAGPRIHTQPVGGLPLIHVTTPSLDGGQKVAKRLFDLICSSILVVTLSPLFLGIAVAVKATSSGPIFYRQERIGLRGDSFNMLKFRSMSVNADDQLQELLQAQGSADKPLFKVSNDPRTTSVGRFIRKYSLDELPQLLNVIAGHMSLVGPRPQREGEVALYDSAARRRLFVSPGMSGLWQISGRSNLSWEESIQLDLYYVENWSLMGDIVILFKTFKAVLASTGAQ